MKYLFPILFFLLSCTEQKTVQIDETIYDERMCNLKARQNDARLSILLAKIPGDHGVDVHISYCRIMNMDQAKQVENRSAFLDSCFQRYEIKE